MKKTTIQKNASMYFESGYNCAESVSMAIIEAFSDTVPDILPRIATAFGGGYGGSRQEACGALSGGLVAIGYLAGRNDLSASPDEAKALAAEFRERYLEKWGATVCEDILNVFEPQEDYHKCRDMVGEAALLLVDILQSKKKLLKESSL